MAANNPPPKFPPLAISDLLALTLTISFALAIVAPHIHDSLSLPSDELRIPRWQLITPEITTYTAFGLALFGLIVLARQRFRGSTGPLSPGHWVFIATGPFAVLRLITGSWREVLVAYWFNNWPVLFQALGDLLFAIVLSLSLAFTLRSMAPQEPRWRVCLLCIATWLLMGCAWCSLEIAQSRGMFRRELIVGWTTAWLAAFVAACVAAAIDVRKGIHRDWLHYTAIVLLALYAASKVLHHGSLSAKWWSGLFIHLLP